MSYLKEKVFPILKTMTRSNPKLLDRFTFNSENGICVVRFKDGKAVPLETVAKGLSPKEMAHFKRVFKQHQSEFLLLRIYPKDSIFTIDHRAGRYSADPQEVEAQLRKVYGLFQAESKNFPD